MLSSLREKYFGFSVYDRLSLTVCYRTRRARYPGIRLNRIGAVSGVTTY